MTGDETASQGCDRLSGPICWDEDTSQNEEALEVRIVKVLLDMDQKPEWQATLATFEPLPGGPEDDLAMLRQLFGLEQ